MPTITGYPRQYLLEKNIALSFKVFLDSKTKENILFGEYSPLAEKTWEAGKKSESMKSLGGWVAGQIPSFSKIITYSKWFMGIMHKFIQGKQSIQGN